MENPKITDFQFKFTSALEASNQKPHREKSGRF
jgi:hypothetical protein